MSSVQWIRHSCEAGSHSSVDSFTSVQFNSLWIRIYGQPRVTSLKAFYLDFCLTSWPLAHHCLHMARIYSTQAQTFTEKCRKTFLIVTLLKLSLLSQAVFSHLVCYYELWWLKLKLGFCSWSCLLFWICLPIWATCLLWTLVVKHWKCLERFWSLCFGVLPTQFMTDTVFKTQLADISFVLNHWPVQTSSLTCMLMLPLYVYVTQNLVASYLLVLLMSGVCRKLHFPA